MGAERGRLSDRDLATKRAAVPAPARAVEGHPLAAVQRRAGNRAAVATAPPPAADPSRFLSAAEWSAQARGTARRVTIQRDGDPVSPARFGHKHEVGLAQGLDVSLSRGMDAGLMATYKMAIKELQRKLMAILGGRTGAGIWKRDGVFGTSTEKAVKKFQRLEGVPETGVVDQALWQRLDAHNVGSSRGRDEYGWTQTMTEDDGTGADLVTGGAAAFDWAKKDDVFNVNVAVNFTDQTAKEAAAVGHIEKAWNTFNIEYKGPAPGGKKRKPRHPRIKLQFNVGQRKQKAGAPVVIAADTEIRLFKSPHPDWATRTMPDDNDKKNRSDMTNWNIDDPTLPKMAPHEFGHLIGLEDEYSRGHANMKRVAGPAAAYSDPAVVGLAAQFAADLAAAKTHQNFWDAWDLLYKANNTPGRVSTLAQLYKDTQGTRTWAAFKAAADAQQVVLEAKAQAAEADITAAAAAAKQADDDITAAANLLTTAKATLDGRADADVPIKTAVGGVEAKMGLLRKEYDDGADGRKESAQWAPLVKLSQAGTIAESQVRKNWVGTKSATSATAAANATTKRADLGAELAALGTAAGNFRSAAEKARADAAKAREDAEAASKQANLAAKASAQTRDSTRQAWQLRGRMGVGRPEAREAQMEKVNADLTQSSAAQGDRRQEASAARKAAYNAHKTAQSAAHTGKAAVAYQSAAGQVGDALKSGADASNVTGAKAAAVADEYFEAASIAATRDEAVDWLKPFDGEGFATAGIMGNFHLAANVARENSPAAEHSHPLQARHVKRFAEYVMKYKPGDLWEAVPR